MPLRSTSETDVLGPGKWTDSTTGENAEADDLICEEGIVKQVGRLTQDFHKDISLT